MPAEKKCSGCRVCMKLHKFGRWGSDCSGSPPGWNRGCDEKPTDVLDQLRIITDRLAKLEVASGTNGATQHTAHLSSDEDVDVESMTRAQMLEYIKNSNKAAKAVGSKRTRFDVEDGEPRGRALSISNLFDAQYLRGQEELNLQKAADKLIEKHRSNTKDTDNRIPGVPTIDDLRRDSRLAGATDGFLRDGFRTLATVSVGRRLPPHHNTAVTICGTGTLTGTAETMTGNGPTGTPSYLTEIEERRCSKTRGATFGRVSGLEFPRILLVN